ncbi:MAG: ABC transporter substrate-binding protein [Proteobacteria bacterium]|nr:ABC transporter substrate-binding protein [Pseudomonadota bacterium]MBU1596287.1 ABC transporter substrate-binding protein [Pseudomonadota bacterium]
MRDRGRIPPLRALACSLVFFLLGLQAACSRAGEAQEELRIGLLAPLTGTVQPYTGHLRAEKLVDRLNAEGGLLVGGRKVRVRLLMEDTGMQVELALSAAARLIRQERVSVLVGPFFSRQAILVARMAEQAQVPMVTPSASNPLVTQGRRFAFRVGLGDPLQGRLLARLCFQDHGLRRVGVLFDESDEYCRELARYFAEAFARLGGTVRLEGYPAGLEDYSGHLGRIRSFGAQALLLPNFTRDVVRQMVQAREAGFGGLFLGGDSWEEDVVLRKLPQAQGAFFTANYPPDRTGACGRSEAVWFWTGAEVPQDTNGAMLLDALGVVLAAARAAGSVDPVALRAGIAALRGFEGFSGQVSFAGGGDAVRGAYALAIEDGKWRCVGVLAPQH